MKKLKYILMAGVALLATACVSDEEDLFEKSAAERMNDLVESNTNLLESSEYGWVFNYYIGHDDEAMGGLVHTVRFKDGKSFFRSEAATDPTEEFGSLYQVKGEQECLLSFDTYNAIFHYWSEPLGSSAPDGYESDYEFTFKSISENQDTITLKGKKYGQYAQLIRLKEDGAEYMEKIAEISEKISAALPRTAAVVNKTDTIAATLYGGVLEYSVTVSAATDEDPDATESTDYIVPYITTLTGIHFYSAVTLGGETFQDCVFDEAANSFVATGANVEFPYIIPAGFMSYEELAGEYTMAVGDDTYNLTVTADGANGYYITGMTYNSTSVYASYNATYGTLQINAQRLDDWRTYQDWLLVYYDGYISWSTSMSMRGSNATNADGKTEITFVSNTSGYNITTFIEYAFTAAPASTTMAGYLTWYDEPMVFVKK